jgi:hypothetical protein
MTGRIPLRLGLAVALVIPVIAFAGTWTMTDRYARQGVEWLVPVEGFDPRDWLRGHFVQYRYDWPMAPQPVSADGQAIPVEVRYLQKLCIVGEAPHIKQVYSLTGDPSEAKHPSCAIIAQATMGTRDEVRGLDTGILFASQERGIALSRKLADPALQGFVRVRIRPDGVMRPVDMEFRAK